MTKKTKIDFIVSILLIICSSVIMILPLLNITNVRGSFLVIMGIYLISNLVNYLLVKETKDTEGIYTFFTSLLSIGLIFILDIARNPMYLAVAILTWSFGMSLVKLKKADYYHDRNDYLWILHIALLCIFILISLLTTINLYYSSEVQILLLGSFFFVNGVLDIVDPIINYIKEKKII